MNRYRKWTVTLLCLCAVPLLAVGLFNYSMDPLWCYSHWHRWNNAQLDLNDRQQKTNALVFCPGDYDSILLGSSLATFINHHDFRGMKIYNYASPRMLPWEYAGYVANAKKAGGRELKNIVIGFDFFGSNKTIHEPFDEPARYYETATSFLYRYKILFNMKTFDFSRRNLLQSRKNSRAVYDRDHVRTFPEVSARQIKVAEQEVTDYFSKNYKYQDELKEMLGRLKGANKSSRFVVFLNPMSKPLFCYVIEQGLMPDYERYVSDLVDQFGEIYNFLYINSVTVDDANFFDAGHYYPKIGTLIARKVTGGENGVPDFGVLVTRDNLAEHLRFLRENSKACSKEGQ